MALFSSQVIHHASIYLPGTDWTSVVEDCGAGSEVGAAGAVGEDILLGRGMKPRERITS